jgi:hypothetical protein
MDSFTKSISSAMPSSIAQILKGAIARKLERLENRIEPVLA